MKNILHQITLFLCLFIGISADAQTCLVGAIEVSEGSEFQYGISEDCYLILLDNFIVISGDTFQANIDILEFENQSALKQLIGCPNMGFGDFHFDISGQIYKCSSIEPNTNGILQLEVLNFEDYGISYSYVIINNFDVYEFVHSPFYTTTVNDHIVTNEVEEEIIHYVLPEDISGSFDLITPAIIDTLVENVLVVDSYDSLEIIPTQFYNDEIVLTSETSECDGAIVELISEQILIKESSMFLEAVPAELETVTEQVALFVSYEGPSYYERKPFVLDTIRQIYTTNIDIIDADVACRNINFLECLTLDINKDTLYSNSVIQSVFPSCIDGYSPAGNYCYTDYADVPYIFETRSYDKLVTPSTTEATAIPAEYVTKFYTKVINADSIANGCVEYAYDTIIVKKIAEPAHALRHLIPAQYGFRSYFKNISPPVFETVPSQETVQSITTYLNDNISLQCGSFITPINLNPCITDRILDSMIEMDLLKDDDVFGSIRFYNALLEFQFDNNLPVGVIDELLLQKLDVK